MRVFVYLVSLCLMFVPVDTVAQVTSEELSKRIDVAGRQRMLTQRIARASCMAMKGIQTEKYHEMLRNDVDLFTRSQRALRAGDPEFGFTPQTSPAVLKLLSIVDELWAELRPAALQLSNGDINNIVIRQMLSRPVETLVAANNVVTALAKQAGAGTISPELATTINLAGRQRMLSQRATKSYCFAIVDVRRAEAVKELVSTVELFNKTLQDLRLGLGGVVKPPTVEIARQLDLVGFYWMDLRPRLLEVVAGYDISSQDFERVSFLSDNVLKEMNRAVGMYASLNDG